MVLGSVGWVWRVVIILKKPSISNKAETLPENPDSPPNKPPAKEASSPKYTPFIDKITIVISVPQNEKAGLNGPHGLHSALFTVLNDPELFADAKKTPGFRIAKRIVLGPSVAPEKRPHFQYDYHESKALKYRLEFSPAGLGEEGLSQLRAAMIPLMPDGWEFVRKYGRVTKIEVSIDLHMVPMASLHVLPQQVTHAKTWSPDGILVETLLLGKSKSNQTRIYDRGAKRKKNNQPSPVYEGTRIERVVRTNILMAQLHNLPNPFATLKLVLLPSMPSEEPKPYIWEMFTDSVKLRSLPVALKLLTGEKRTLYRKWCAQNPVEGWNPAEIWSEWPAYLKSTSLFD